eukprot:3138718-Alexandrium_andersonii.AAC.1
MRGYGAAVARLHSDCQTNDGPHVFPTSIANAQLFTPDAGDWGDADVGPVEDLVMAWLRGARA